MALVFGISKPSYRPVGVQKVDFRAANDAAFADSAPCRGSPVRRTTCTTGTPAAAKPTRFDKLMGRG
jgi:hypothetical protein